MPIRTSVKDQSVLQKRAAAGAILRSMGLGGGSHPTSKSIFWAQDAQLAGFDDLYFQHDDSIEFRYSIARDLSKISCNFWFLCDAVFLPLAYEDFPCEFLERKL